MTTNSPFYFSNFFQNTGIFQSLFDTHENAWESISFIEEFIMNFKNSGMSAGYTEITEGVFVGENVQIDDTARIKGHAIIGSNTVVGHAAFLREGVLIGEGVNVGHATEVKHSIILSNAKLAHLNYIGDSIVGSNVNISGSATLANWRFDKKEVVIRHNDEKISTGINKLGSIMGDDCFIGVSAVINPGTILAKGTLVYPLVSVKGTHLSSETIKS